MFIISPYNSLRFAIKDGLLPNPSNRLHSELYQPGLKIIPYCQLIQISDTSEKPITIQIRTDYDNVTARIVNNGTGTSTLIAVDLKASYPNAPGGAFATWEFNYTFNEIGNFTIFVNGTDSVQDDIEYESEPIDVAIEHKDTLRIDAFNTKNTENVDYSTGIRHFLRIKARNPDADNERDEDIYDDQNKKTKTYFAPTFNGELTTDPIPEYLVRQIDLMQGLFNFYINDFRYTGTDFSVERFGKTTSKQVTLISAEYETPGVNSDDSGQIPEPPTPEDMENITFSNLTGATGSQQLSVEENYWVKDIQVKLVTGTSGNVAVKLEPTGDPITIFTLSSGDLVKREMLNMMRDSDYGNSFIVYFDITGVGATVNIDMVTVRYR